MKKSLWLALERYNFDHVVPPSLGDRVMKAFGGPDASLQAFATKLSTKLGWELDFTLRAIEEYKKYLFLGLVSRHSVTPSRVIDEVWHAHILFTRAYRQFCQEVFGHPFDHDPELIPVDEQTGVFQAQYLATLDLYRREFGSEPPAEIWGTPKFKRLVQDAGFEPREKHMDGVAAGAVPERAPLHRMFDPSSHAEHHLTPASAETLFGGEGGFGGGGSGRSWSDSTDFGHAESGTSDAGGDSSGASSGSSCSSSSCGGGGCGGGGCSS
jgi:hypothetical protein